MNKLSLFKVRYYGDPAWGRQFICSSLFVAFSIEDVRRELRNRGDIDDDGIEGEDYTITQELTLPTEPGQALCIPW